MRKIVAAALAAIALLSWAASPMSARPPAEAEPIIDTGVDLDEIELSPALRRWHERRDGIDHEYTEHEDGSVRNSLKKAPPPPPRPAGVSTMSYPTLMPCKSALNQATNQYVASAFWVSSTAVLNCNTTSNVSVCDGVESRMIISRFESGAWKLVKDSGWVASKAAPSCGETTTVRGQWTVTFDGSYKADFMGRWLTSKAGLWDLPIYFTVPTGT